MSPINIGFIGLSAQGWASTVLAPPLFSEPLSSEYKLVAVSTTNARSATASAVKYSDLTKTTVKAYHGSADHIASDKDVDLVAISIRAPGHFDAAMKVIEQGKDLFLEWPAGKNLKETEALAEAAKAKGIRTLVGLQGRSSPYVNKVKSIVESGAIGRVVSTSMIGRFHYPVPIYGPKVLKSLAFTADVTNSTNLLHIIAAGHSLDTIMYCLGPLTSVSATTAVSYPTAIVVDDNGEPTGETVSQDSPNQVAFTGTLEGGALLSAHFHAGLSTPIGGKHGTPPLLWTIQGEKGSIRVVSDSPGGVSIQLTPNTIYLNGEEVKVDDDGTPFTGKAWMAFAKGEAYPTLDDALKTKRVTDAVERSAKEGRRITV